jgi:hypothetical protein
VGGGAATGSDAAVGSDGAAVVDGAAASDAALGSDAAAVVDEPALTRSAVGRASSAMTTHAPTPARSRTTAVSTSHRVTGSGRRPLDRGPRPAAIVGEGTDGMTRSRGPTTVATARVTRPTRSTYPLLRSGAGSHWPPQVSSIWWAPPWQPPHPLRAASAPSRPRCSAGSSRRASATRSHCPPSSYSGSAPSGYPCCQAGCPSPGYGAPNTSEPEDMVSATWADELAHICR